MACEVLRKWLLPIVVLISTMGTFLGFVFQQPVVFMTFFAGGALYVIKSAYDKMPGSRIERIKTLVLQALGVLGIMIAGTWPPLVPFYFLYISLLFLRNLPKARFPLALVAIAIVTIGLIYRDSITPDSSLQAALYVTFHEATSAAITPVICLSTILIVFALLFASNFGRLRPLLASTLLSSVACWAIALLLFFLQHQYKPQADSQDRPGGKICNARELAALVLSRYFDFNANQPDRNGPIGWTTATLSNQNRLSKRYFIIVVSGTNFSKGQNTGLAPDLFSMLALQNRYEADLHDVIRIMDHTTQPIGGILIVGHSLGGMASWLQAFRRDYEPYRWATTIITFGAPPPVHGTSNDSPTSPLGRPNLRAFRAFTDSVPLVTPEAWMRLGSSSETVIDYPSWWPFQPCDRPQCGNGRELLGIVGAVATPLVMSPVLPYVPFLTVRAHFSYADSRDLENFDALGDNIGHSASHTCLVLEHTIRGAGIRAIAGRDPVRRHRDSV
jgi:pimeloyl-ACP methyl ester carboxylesterase